MLSSSVTETISLSWNSDSSSIGSCSVSEVVGCSISNPDVHAQAHWSGAIRAREEKLQEVHGNHSVVEGPHTRKLGIEGTEDCRRSGQGLRGRVCFETNFVYNVDSRGGNNKEVNHFLTFFCYYFAIYIEMYHRLEVLKASRE